MQPIIKKDIEGIEVTFTHSKEGEYNKLHTRFLFDGEEYTAYTLYTTDNAYNDFVEMMGKNAGSAIRNMKKPAI